MDNAVARAVLTLVGKRADDSLIAIDEVRFEFAKVIDGKNVRKRVRNVLELGKQGQRTLARLSRLELSRGQRLRISWPCLLSSAGRLRPNALSGQLPSMSGYSTKRAIGAALPVRKGY